MNFLKNKGPLELVGALVLIGIGVFTIWEGSHYNIGALARMGPGYFPVALGVIMIFLGILVALTGEDREEEAESLKEEAFSNEWRGWACILGGIVLFILFGAWFGLVPGTLALVFVSAMGDKTQKVTSAIVLSIVVALIGAIIFRFFLELQFPLFRWGW